MGDHTRSDVRRNSRGRPLRTRRRFSSDDQSMKLMRNNNGQHILILAVLSISPTIYAQEIGISCKFGSAILPQFDSSVDSWYTSYASSNERKFVISLEPPKMLVSPQPSQYWNEPRFDVSTDELTLQWGLIAHLPDRHPTIRLRINRFSGEAFELFRIDRLNAPKDEPQYVWSRTGKCEVHKRKF
ncbi:hypothetical protein RA210_U580003 [Rubrivivax sp. A210]|nr:hypothetical protein RA210_U580003 [Rubrivivax sp. A210]